ncbi:MAG: hypothetical protein NWE93_06705 [Candidatus Bathyarchaeota archaeon]|nr:hypothetical protein [Candidatus Bathyarchaeota archaeon]
MNLEEKAKKIQEPVTQEAKEEVEQIRQSGDPKVAFFELIIEIEKKLRFLDNKTDLNLGNIDLPVVLLIG